MEDYNELDFLIRGLEEFAMDLNKEFYQATKKHEATAIEMVQMQLLEEGIAEDGRRLQEYAPATKRWKKSKGDPYDRTTLFDTGEFQSGFELEYEDTQSEFWMWSYDEKTQDLHDKYSKADSSIFGLTTENKAILAKLVKNEIASKLKSSLNL